MPDFLHMGGYGPYVWSAYGLVFAVMILLGIQSWRRQRLLSQQAQRLRNALRRHRREAEAGETT